MSKALRTLSGTLVAGEIAPPRGAPSASRQRKRSEARDEPIQDNDDDDDDDDDDDEEEEEEGFGRRSMSPPSEEDIVYVVCLMIACTSFGNRLSINC